MRGAICESVGGPVVVVDDVEVDEPRAGEVLVRVAHCGVCHSDLTVQHAAGARPVMLGHEAGGWVEAVGPGVAHVEPDDAVVCTVVAACGSCYFCSRGQASICVQTTAAFLGTLPAGGTGFRRGGQPVYRSVGVGAFTERVVMAANAVVRVPSGTPLAEACLLGCGVGTGLGAALNTAHVQPGDAVVVFGLGGVGIAAVQGARVAGASRIIGVDPVEERRETACQLGATDVFDPTSDDVRRRVASVTAFGADHAIETSGRADAFSVALTAIRPGGTVTLVGVPSHADATYPIDNVLFAILGEKRIQGCSYGSSHPQRDIPRYLAMAQAGSIDLAAMVSAHQPLDNVAQAFDDLAAGRGIRTVIDL
jgi:S-(hydroxymethyl)glutathione dehydrogenase/alcohol dehydrogenase